MLRKHTKPIFLRMIGLLNATNQYTRRHDYAFRHSGGITESTKELDDNEMIAVINELEDTYRDELAMTFKADDQCDRMRKKIIAKAHGMNWVINGKADMQRINLWCINKGPYHKPLRNHDIKELGILVTVFDNIYRHYMNKI